MIGLAGLLGTLLPLFVTASSAWGPLRGLKLWRLSLASHLISWCCFALLLALGFFGNGRAGSSAVLSPAILAQSLWSDENSLLWTFPLAALCLAACTVTVSFHFIARNLLEASRASVAGLAAYLTCLLGALGSSHPLLFSIFLAGSLLPRLVFTGMDVKDGKVDAVKETAFLSIVALLALLISVLAFAAPFRDALANWFKIESAERIVLPGSIGLSLMLLAVAISAGIFPFHGNARRIFQMRSMERAVPLALQPIFGFVLLFKFGQISFPNELNAFSSFFLGLFSVGIAYGAVCFLGSRTARDRVFWLQQLLSSFIAVGFFSLTIKGWHGAQVLLVFQSIAVPFFLLVLACHERRSSMLPLKEISRYPAFALSTALAALFALFLPLSVGFFGVLLVTWSLVGLHEWPLPFLIFSMPLIALGGVRIMYFRLGDIQSSAEPVVGGFIDLQRDEIFAIFPIGLILLLLGLMPHLLMGPVGVSVAATMRILGFKN